MKTFILLNENNDGETVTRKLRSNRMSNGVPVLMMKRKGTPVVQTAKRIICWKLKFTMINS